MGSLVVMRAFRWFHHRLISIEPPAREGVGYPLIKPISFRKNCQASDSLPKGHPV